MPFQFYGVLPWERDEDAFFPAQNLSILRRLVPDFRKNGYNLLEFKMENEQCIENNGGEYDYCAYYDLKSKHWRIQMYGFVYMGNYLKNFFRIHNATKVFELV